MKSPQQLLHEAINVTDNPNFWKWFGQSKVVDGRNNPLVVYHGTKADFDKFWTWPIYFTPDPNAASSYSEHSMEPRDNQQPKPNVMAVFLRIENPLIVTSDELDEMIGGVDDRDWGALEYYAEKAEKAGHDGMHLINVIDFSGMDGKVTLRRAYDQWIAFNPNQIKSATGNNGNFDPNDPDITK